MTRFFAKELPEQPIYISGRPYRFDFLATEDAWLIGELQNAALSGVGGIIEITKDAYDESLKKKSGTPSPPSFLNRRPELVAPQFQPPAPGARPAVLVGDNRPGRNGPPPLSPAEPITVTPPRVFLPQVGKAPK